MCCTAQGLKPGFGDNLEGQDGVGGGREAQRKGTYVYLQLIYVDIGQKPIQYCKAIIPQLKLNKILKTHKNCNWTILEELGEGRSRAHVRPRTKSSSAITKSQDTVSR